MISDRTAALFGAGDCDLNRKRSIVGLDLVEGGGTKTFIYGLLKTDLAHKMAMKVRADALFTPGAMVVIEALQEWRLAGRGPKFSLYMSTIFKRS